MTYCSRGYEDAYRWVLPSWRRKEIGKIIVVSDFQIDDPMDGRVEWINSQEPCEEYYTNNSRRPGVVRKYMPDGLVAFFDLDCWIRGDITPAFGAPDTISVTRFWSRENHTGGTITSGTWYANVGPGVRRFVEGWDELTEKMRRTRKNWHTNPRHTTAQQYTFTSMCHTAFRTGEPCHINTIPEQIYNCEHSSPEALAIKARQNRPAVVHFKGRTFRDAKHVAHILKCAEGKA